MKAILLWAGMLALTGFPVQAGTNIFVSIGGGGYHGFVGTSGGRCAYTTGYPYRSCGYVGFPGYGYGGYGGYIYSGYASAYSPVSYDTGAYAPTYVQPAPPPAPVSAPAPAATPAPAPQATAATPAPAPAPAQLPFGILDVNGFVHSPYSDSIFKVPGVRNAQMVYDPVTGKPFLVR